MDLVFDALGLQVRRDIVAMLRQGPLPVGEIARHLPISRPAVSKHLKLLEEAGLVEHAARGTSNVFTLRTRTFQEAALHLEGFWSEALQRFQRIAEE